MFCWGRAVFMLWCEHSRVGCSQNISYNQKHHEQLHAIAIFSKKLIKLSSLLSAGPIYIPARMDYSLDLSQINIFIQITARS